MKFCYQCLAQADDSELKCPACGFSKFYNRTQRQSDKKMTMAGLMKATAFVIGVPLSLWLAWTWVGYGLAIWAKAAIAGLLVFLMALVGFFNYLREDFVLGWEMFARLRKWVNKKPLK